MYTVLDALFELSSQMGLSRLVVSLENDTLLNKYINKNIQSKRVFDRRSSAYFAMGLSQQSNQPVMLFVNGDNAGIADILPGITEAYYQNVPILCVVLTQSSNRWLDDFETAIGDKCTYCTDLTLVPPDKVVSKLNEALLSLTHFGGGPVSILVDSDRPCVNDPALTKRICEENLSASTEEIKLQIKSHKPRVILDDHDFYTSSDRALLRRFSKEYSISFFDEDIFLTAALENNQITHDYDMVLQFGSGILPNLESRLAKTKKPFIYWRISESLSLDSAIGNIDTHICCNWRVLVGLLLGKTEPIAVSECNCAQTHIVHREAAALTDIIDISVSNIISEICSPCYVYGMRIFGRDISQLYKSNLNLQAVSYVDPTGGDGKLSVFIGQCLALAPERNLCFIDSNDFFRDMNALHIRHITDNTRICLFCTKSGDAAKAQKWAEISGFETRIICDISEINPSGAWLTALNTIHPRIVIIQIEEVEKT